MAAIAAWTASAAGQAATQETPAFSAAAEIVTIDAVVVGRDGPVRGLTRDDFLVIEDGEPRAITHFEAVISSSPDSPPARGATASTTSSNEGPLPRAPRSFVIVYDDLHIDSLRSAGARDSVSGFLSREVRAGDRVALVFTGSGAWWTADIPEGREDLLAFVDGQAAGRSTREDLTDAEAQRIAEYDDDRVREWVVDRWVMQGRCEDLCQYTSPCDPREGRRACSDQVRAEALQRQAAARHGLERTLRTMAAAMEGVAGERGRKALVLVSEGFVFDPGIPAYREVVQASLRANTAVHFLDVRGLQATSAVSDVSQRGDFPGSLRAISEDSQLAAAGAEQVAEDSGGFVIRHGNDLSAGLGRVAREAEVYYLLGYAPPPGSGKAAFRKVVVRLARPGAEVRARKGYFVDASGRVAGPGEPATWRPAPAKPADRREALPPSILPRQDLRLQAAAYVGPPADRGRSKVRLVAEIDLTSLRGRKDERPLELRGDVWPRNGKEWVGLDRRLKLEPRPDGGSPAWHPLTWDVALPPGVYQARLRLRDAGSGSEGTLTHRFEVKEAKGLRFATPIVTHVLRREGSGGPSLVAGASRVFATGAGHSLYVQLELLGAPPSRSDGRSVTARVALRDDTGREVRSVPPGPVAADAGGRLVRALGFGLDDVAPGAYLLVLEGRDERSGATCSHEESLVLRASPSPGEPD